MKHKIPAGLYTLFIVLMGCFPQEQKQKPNILLAISDDQSYPHASAYGYEAISTPAFDRVAEEGILFHNAFAASPGCSPSRAALLTGRNCWQIEEAGTHASRFPKKYVTYTTLLEEAGYKVGHTGKGWGPGDYEVSGRTKNPAGKEYDDIKMESPEGISSVDYAANFKAFLDERKNDDQPFSFWYGAHEPHRSFKKGIGRENGLDIDKVKVPEFLPDTREVRDDILDYLYEIQWFDNHLQRILRTLEEAGELENTLVVVTSDNGMAFPRAKANAYEMGIHVPLAIMWGDQIKPGREVDDLISLIDLAPTFLEIAGATHPSDTTGNFPMAGKSLTNIFESEQEGIVDPSREAVFSSRERHSYSRWNNLGYPQRAMRTHDHLYIRNFAPERWPAGAPRKYKDEGTLGPPHGGYHDIDACPTMDFLVENRDHEAYGRYFHLAVDKRPAEEMFDISEDMACLHNLTNNPEYNGIHSSLSNQLDEYLRSTEDPRVMGNGQVFEDYPRLRGPMREFPEP